VVVLHAMSSQDFPSGKLGEMEELPFLPSLEGHPTVESAKQQPGLMDGLDSFKPHSWGEKNFLWKKICGASRFVLVKGCKSSGAWLDQTSPADACIQSAVSFVPL